VLDVTPLLLLPKSTMASPVSLDSHARVHENPPAVLSSRFVKSNIWYKDGSVVIQAENVAFCVHGQLLAKHSPVLKEMLPGDPQHPNHGRTSDLPLLLLSEKARDVEFILIQLYDRCVNTLVYTSVDTNFLPQSISSRNPASLDHNIHHAQAWQKIRHRRDVPKCYGEDNRGLSGYCRAVASSL